MELYARCSLALDRSASDVATVIACVMYRSFIDKKRCEDVSDAHYSDRKLQLMMNKDDGFSSIYKSACLEGRKDLVAAKQI